MDNLNINIWPALENYLRKYDRNEFYYLTDRLENRCTVFQKYDIDFEIAFREYRAAELENRCVQVIITFREPLYKFFQYLLKERKERLEQDNVFFSLKDTTGHKILFINSKYNTFADVDNLEDIFKWLTDTGIWFYNIIVKEIKLYNNGSPLPESKTELLMAADETPKLIYKRDKNEKEKEKALAYAGYKCEIATLKIENYKDKHNGAISEDVKNHIYNRHRTFNKENGLPYMEVHHLIPFHLQEKFDISIDIRENMICLCPTCHRMLHYMEIEKRKKILVFIYQKRNLGKVLGDYGIKGITLKKFLELACKNI